MSVATEFTPVFAVRSGSHRSTGRVLGTHGRHDVRPRAPRGARVHVATAATPLRLTRRGIVLAWVATVLVGVLMLAVAYLSWQSTDAPVAKAHPTGTVRVEPGDTLWSIAGRIDPSRDPRDVVSDLRRLNGLGSAAVTPGQLLTVG